MRYGLLVLACLGLAGCSSPAAPIPDDGSTDAAALRNDDNTEGGLCCQITNNFTDEPYWNNRRYTCMHPGEDLKPFNPPWVCNVTFDGHCGNDGDSGLDCLNCFDPTCVVGMRCRDVNGTGAVIPCK